MIVTKFVLIILLIINTTVILLPASDISINVKADRQDSLYKCGENAVFYINLTNNDQPVRSGKILVKLTIDGLNKIKEKEINLGKEPLEISGQLMKPGFLRCEVKYKKGEKTHMGYAAAGFEPEHIKTMTILPNNFDSFWAVNRAELAAIPLDIKQTSLPEYSSKENKCFKISFANIDNTRIYAYMNIPVEKTGQGSQNKVYPAYIEVPGAGVGKPKRPIISKKMITLIVSVHNHDLGLSPEVYKVLREGSLKDYYYLGAPNRNLFYYRRAILGLDRAIDYIAARPDFNGKLAIYGGSQGGYFSLIMAGFNRHITAATASAPAMLDHAGYLAGRLPGGTQLVLHAPKGQRQKWLKMSAFFDGVNFARKIKCPVIISTGFIDLSCSPSSVYAAFNIIKAPKQIFNEPLMGHETSLQFQLFKVQWIEGQLGLRKLIAPTKN